MVQSILIIRHRQWPTEITLTTEKLLRNLSLPSETYSGRPKPMLTTENWGSCRKETRVEHNFGRPKLTRIIRDGHGSRLWLTETDSDRFGRTNFEHSKQAFVDQKRSGLAKTDSAQICSARFRSTGFGHKFRSSKSMFGTIGWPIPEAAAVNERPQCASTCSSDGNWLNPEDFRVFFSPSRPQRTGSAFRAAFLGRKGRGGDVCEVLLGNSYYERETILFGRWLRARRLFPARRRNAIKP